MRGYLCLVLFLTVLIFSSVIHAEEKKVQSLQPKGIAQSADESIEGKKKPADKVIVTTHAELVKQYDLNRDGVIDFQEAERFDERNEAR